MILSANVFFSLTLSFSKQILNKAHFIEFCHFFMWLHTLEAHQMSQIVFFFCFFSQYVSFFVHIYAYCGSVFLRFIVRQLFLWVRFRFLFQFRSSFIGASSFSVLFVFCFKLVQGAIEKKVFKEELFFFLSNLNRFNSIPTNAISRHCRDKRNPQHTHIKKRHTLNWNNSHFALSMWLVFTSINSFLFLFDVLLVHSIWTRERKRKRGKKRIFSIVHFIWVNWIIRAHV